MSQEMTVERFKNMNALQREAFLKKCTKDELAEHDGKLFINLSSTSKNKVGRVLSFHHKQPFSSTEFGNFNTLEGFWLWLKIEGRPDALRTMSGRAANEFAKKLKPVYSPTFKPDFIEGLCAKIRGNDEIYRAIIEAPDVPVVSYYFHGKNNLMIYAAGRQWVYDAIELIIAHFKKNDRDQPFVYEGNS